MLKTKLPKQTARQTVEYHAQDNKGLTPVVEDDSDLIDWMRYVLVDVGGLTEEDCATLTITVAEEHVIIGGSDEVMDTVGMYML